MEQVRNLFENRRVYPSGRATLDKIVLTEKIAKGYNMSIHNNP